MLTLPADVVQAFSDNESSVGLRDAYIVRLRGLGWTLSSIASAANLSRERVRQVIASQDPSEPQVPIGTLPLPSPPMRPTKRGRRVPTQPSDVTLARLKALQPMAQKVRSNGPQFRAEGEEYSSLLNYARTTEGVSLYTLAKLLGVTHAALRFRLTRYGYLTPGKGKSKAYQPIRESNRAR